MNLIIFTQRPKQGFFDVNFFLRQTKNLAKKIFGKRDGPEAVSESLIRGLKELEFDFQLNLPPKDIKSDSIAAVISDIRALKFAIDLKRRGKIKKILAGPNLVVTPLDENRIILNEKIDLIIVNSEWTKNFYLSLAPELKNKIEIWFTGVEIPKNFAPKEPFCLIYKKKCPIALFNFIENFLQKNCIPYKKVEYGNYRKSDYYKLLEKAKFIIFLSESESQGIALFEAWSFNVPTLVWNRGYWRYKNYEWFDAKISAPYLEDECGLFFKNEKDFGEKFAMFVEKLNTFKPRDYIIKNFSNKESAKKFIELTKRF